MSRLAIAQQFIKDHQFELAQKVLENLISPDVLKLRSLLYRYKDDYDHEKIMIENAKQLNISNEYTEERLKWHALDNFNKCEPRQSLVLPKYPDQLPLSSTIEQMCFVTSGDHNFMPHMIECLESLTALPSYKNVPIHIVDCGLNDDDRHYLQQNFNIGTIKDPGWDYDVSHILQVNRENPKAPHQDTVKSYHKSLTCRPFLKKHFPGFRYYCYVDADAWVQDERCIDRLLKMCENQGVGVSQHQVCKTCKEHPWHTSGILNESQKNFIADKARIIASLFCLDATSGIDDEWAKTFGEAIQTQGYWYNTDEQTLNYCIHKRGIDQILDTGQHYGLCSGVPVIDEDFSQTLRDPRSGQIIGSFHLGGRVKDFFFYPTQKMPPFFSAQWSEQHCTHFVDWRLFQACVQYQCLPHQLQIIPDQKIISCHYRVLPWQDKVQIMAEVLLCQS